MKENTFDIIKGVLKILVLLTIFSIALIMISYVIDSKFIDSINKLIESDTKVLYISTKDNYMEYPIKMLDKYEIEYKYINASNLSSIEKSKIKGITNSNNLDNLLVVYKDGVIIGQLSKPKTNNEVVKFLQEQGVIPFIIGDVKNILSNTNKLLQTDYTMIYVPYKYEDEIENRDNVFKSISQKYDINYEMIKAYLLSDVQKLKLNSLLQVSEVEDQIVILIKNKNIIGSIRNVCSEAEYVSQMKEYNFIWEKESKLSNINYNRFVELIGSDDKNIIVIGKDNCKYCDSIIAVLNDIVIENDLTVYYLDIKSFESDMAKKVEKKLIELNYSDGFSTPITIITESNRIIDFIVGDSSREYFINVFNEIGLIKR